jgi:hypothetical protein
MVSDSTPSRIYTASCFEDKDHSTTKDSTAGENMMSLKRPLITMSNELLEDEGQTRLQNETQSRSIICKSFLLGSSFGFALQAMSYAAYYMLFKMFGKDTPPGPSSLLSSFSYCLLVLISQLYAAIFIATWLTFGYTLTKSGSLSMRKKFDKDAATPNSGSIWTTRMLFIVGVYFLTGATIGSVSFRTGMALYIGVAIPWMPLFRAVMIDFATLLLTAKWFDWSRPIEQELEYDTIEQELEDDHSCIV